MALWHNVVQKALTTEGGGVNKSINCTMNCSFCCSVLQVGWHSQLDTIVPPNQRRVLPQAVCLLRLILVHQSLIINGSEDISDQFHPTTCLNSKCGKIGNHLTRGHRFIPPITFLDIHVDELDAIAKRWR